MNDNPDDCGDDDRRIASETTADLQANRFDLEADDLEADDIDDLLEVETEDIDDLLEVETEDIDDLLEVDTDDIDEFLDREFTEADDIDDLLAVDDDDLEAAAAQLQADRYAEEVARRWGTPEGEWWP